MIHGRKGRKLKRTVSHRKALLSNLSVALIKNKKIETTLAKAKELRGYFEKLLTKSRRAAAEKNGSPDKTLHQRRIVNSYLKDPGAVKTLFDEIAPKLADRQGGYTRVVKLGRRLGDAAELAVIELVDYNTGQTEQKGPEKSTQSSKGKLLKSFGKRKSKKPAEKKTAENAGAGE